MNQYGESHSVSVLDTEEIWRLLGKNSFGRLVLVVDRRVDIFPINYASSPDRAIIFQTASGTKLAELTVNEKVLFEVDDISSNQAWSVMVRGHAQWLQKSAEIQEAEDLKLRPWVPTLKDHYVRIIPTEISGRRFQFAADSSGDLGEGSRSG
ncbi:pyridoxamine 5'-phosphate oxidase family protein [Nesterenkonia natronophila]|nr:pyridoxamine 5'-phosphate oxidase family protein [Nesterenkonia natronophila]